MQLQRAAGGVDEAQATQAAAREALAAITLAISDGTLRASVATTAECEAAAGRLSCKEVATPAQRGGGIFGW